MSQSPVPTAVMTLDSLLMRTGPLASLDMPVAPWTAIADQLRETYPAEQWTTYVAELCTVYYKHDKTRFVHTKKYGEQSDQIIPVTDFLQNFMMQNGQWPYLRQQPWFQSGAYVIAVDINYYPDRSGHKVAPLFHKDTGGNNIFVNLIFDNEGTIEATEWFADLSQPSVQRAQWQEKLLPPEHLAELQAARKTLAPEHDGKDVRGGVTEGQYVFVSWVDDLVWHATPSTTQRLELKADLAIAMYTQVGEQMLKPPTPENDDFLFNHAGQWVSALSVVGSIAECSTTALHAWLADKKLGPQDVTNTLAPQAWQVLYAGPDGRATYERDVRERATTDWRVTARATESIAKDSTLAGSEAIKETPVGLSGRRRTNSKAPEVVEEVKKLNEGVPRTFIRTWVRILPATTSQELADNNVVF